MKYTPNSTYSTIYLGAYPAPGGGGPKGASYYLNIPTGVTIEPDQPTSTGGGAPGVSAIGSKYEPLTNGAIVNFGNVIGGVGAPGTSSDNDGSGGDSGVAIGNGATGGIGIDLSFHVPYLGYGTPFRIALTNEKGATITGGAGAAGGEEAAGGTGGIGVSLTGYPNDNYNGGPLYNDGTITGGMGGAGGQGVYAQGTGGPGGTGGVGVYLAHNTTGWGSTNVGVIRGGDGGGAPAGAANEPGNTSGSGGIGVQLGENSNLINYGHIYGGNGADSTFTQGGNGGAGVSIFTAADPGKTPAGDTSNTLFYRAYQDVLETGIGTIVGGNGLGTGTSGGAGLEIFEGFAESDGGGGFSGQSGYGSITGGNGGMAGGVGVYLDGGAFIAFSHISGGIGQNDGLADSVQFGREPGRLIVGYGAAFNGDIGGFVPGDTIEFLNLTPKQVASYFNANTDTITAPNYTLKFSGNFAGDEFTFTKSDYASEKNITTTLVSLIGSNNANNKIITGPTTTPIVVGGPNYPDGVDVATDGSVTPTAYGATGVYSYAPNAGIMNQGAIAGGAGQQAASYGGAGGVGVQVTASATVTNSGSVYGGTGGTSTGENSQSQGGTGGAGVYVKSSSTNASINDILTQLKNFQNGNIGGGNGGTSTGGYSQSQGGAGGAGVYVKASTSFYFSADLSNYGKIQGGNGGSDYKSAAAAKGGNGVDFYSVYPGSNASVYNAGNIAGGNAASGGQGGDGLFANYHVTVDLTTSSISKISGGAGYGGVGGTGIVLQGLSDSITNLGTVLGGIGNGMSGQIGGTGGIGVAQSGGTFTNGGLVAGGSDGTGGAGLQLDGGSAYDSGSITGGTGGNGGVGVDFEAGALFIQASGSVTGGSAGGAGYTAGAGVYFGGGVLTTAGIISGGGATPSVAVQFGPGGYGELKVRPGAQFHGAISGFTVSDAIDLTTVSVSQAAAYFGVTGVPADATTLTIAGSASEPSLMTPTEGTLTLTGSFLGDSFLLSSDRQGGTDITLETAPACYLRGTLIRTEHGEVAIERLAIGDRIPTLSGELRAIRWIGHRRHSGARIERDRDIQPVLVEADALAPGIPRRDLWVSPEHAMYLDGMLIPARALVNGTSIRQEQNLSDVTYFHLELEEHAVIWAEGAPSESFVDEASREMFDNAEQFHRLYPHAEPRPTELCAPRVEEGWEVARVRERLASRPPWGAAA